MRRLTLLTALFLCSICVTEAGAVSDPLGGGSTRVVLDGSFREFLERADVTLVPRAPARLRGRTLVFPVAGGHLDPQLGEGEIVQSGAFVLRNSRRSIPFRKLITKTTRSPLVAKVGGSQLKVATAGRLSSERNGFSARFRADGLRLTAKVATRLNKKLRPREPFFPGQRIGSLLSAPRPSLATVLPVGRATLLFDPAFLSKLNEHFVSLNPIFPAEREGPVFTLPIAQLGALAPTGFSGMLRTGGEIEYLQLGAGQVFWQELEFDLGGGVVLAEADIQPAPPFPGRLGPVSVLALAGAAVSADPVARTISAGGVSLALSAAMAANFNQAFAAGKDDFKVGEPVASLSFAAQGQ